MKLTFRLLAVVIVLLLFQLAPPVHAFNVSLVNGLDTDRIIGFPEIGDMRELLLLSYYSQDRKNLSQSFETFSSYSVDYIGTFSSAYDLSLSNDSDNHALALQKARELKNITAKLQANENGVMLADNMVQLAQSSTERFIVSEGDYLVKKAGDAVSTRDKLSYYDRAIEAMQLSGDEVSASGTLALKQQLQMRYDRDMANANSSLSAGSAALSSALGSEGFAFGLLSYAQMRQAQGQLLEARTIYAKNAESQGIAQTDAELEMLSSLDARLSPSVGKFFFLVGGTLVASVLFFVWRFREWAEDDYDCSLGVEVAKYGHEL